MGPPANDRLRELASALGIETGYWDIRGHRREAGADALVAAMAAMGVTVDGAGGPEAGVDRYLDQQRHDITDPVVVWGDAALAGQVIVPTSRRSATLDVTVRLEGGGERHSRLDAAELPVVAPGPMMRPAPGEEVRAFALPGPWPIGYHELVIGSARAEVLVAPVIGTQFDPHDRLWGVLAPVYALNGGSGLGAHIGNLAAMADALGPLGGRIVATLPLLATFLGTPAGVGSPVEVGQVGSAAATPTNGIYDPSPYAPVSRRYWNELFVDLAALPELAAVPVAAENLSGLASFGHAANVRGRHFDYRHQYGYVRGVLEQIVAARAGWPVALAEAFAEYEAARPDVTDYARFRAFAEARGTGWRAWPDPQRGGQLDVHDVDPEVVTVHVFGQYALERDLAALGDHLRRGSQRLYLDLPVGAHTEGYDTWREPDLFAWGADAGAPPDDFFALGQNWGFPPLRPHRRGNGHLHHVRAVVRHHMQVAGIMRLDHAMSLERLFWVPDGVPARDGVYVRYPRAALLAVLTIESSRSGCVIVGEDLGTVTDSVRDAMTRHGLLGMYVAEFSQPSWDGAPLEEPRRHQMAFVDTHDTPTLVGWLHGLDIDRRHLQGMLDDDGAERARADRRAQVRNLVATLVQRGDVVRGTVEEDERAVLQGLLRFLGTSDSPAVLVAVDDLVGETNPQNEPGTGLDRPNWVQRVRTSAAELGTDHEIVELLEQLQAHRLGAHLRAREADGGAR